MPSVGWVPRLSNPCRWANVGHQNVSLPLHLIFSYIVSLLVALGLSEHEQHTQNSELQRSQSSLPLYSRVQLLQDLMLSSQPSARLFCWNRWAQPLDCLRKRGIRGRHWSVFLKEEKKRAERKHWSKNPDVCSSTSLLLLPGYFHPVRVTWTPRTMTFSCALSENDRIISQRGFSFHFDHDNLSQYMVLQ